MTDDVTVGPWAALRELHSPYVSSFEVLCSGCPGDMERGQPDWPCASADLLYTPDEVAELAASFQPGIDEYRAEQRRRRQHTLDHGSPTEKAVLASVDRMVELALRPTPYFTSLVQGDDVKTSIVVPISKEWLGG